MSAPIYNFIKNPRWNRFGIEVPLIDIRDAEIAWTNFSGAPDKFNRNGGNRYFTVIIRDHEVAQKIADYGYHMTISRPRNEDDESYYKLRVNVRYKREGDATNKKDPQVNLYTNGNRTIMSERNIGTLDSMDISEVGLLINPNISESRDNPGTPHVTAYLDTGHFVQNVSALDSYYAKFAEEESPADDMPF